MDNTPRANGLPSGYITFPAAVWVWQGIIRPGDETRSMVQWNRFADDLIQAVWDGRLKAHFAGMIIEAQGFPSWGEAFRKILNGDFVELGPPHVPSPTTGIVAFLSEAVAEAARGERQAQIDAEAERWRALPRWPLAQALQWVRLRRFAGLAEINCFSDSPLDALFGPGPWEPKASEWLSRHGHTDSHPDPAYELERALAAEQVRAWGRKLGKEDFEEIDPAHFRADWTISVRPGKVAHTVNNSRGNVARDPVEVCRDGLLAAFPSLEVAAAGAPRSDGPAMEKARAIAREAIRSGRKLTKAALKEELRAHGIEPTKKGFDRIYNAVKEEEDKRQAFQPVGRPRNN